MRRLDDYDGTWFCGIDLFEWQPLVRIVSLWLFQLTKGAGAHEMVIQFRRVLVPAIDHLPPLAAQLSDMLLSINAEPPRERGD